MAKTEREQANLHGVNYDYGSLEKCLNSLCLYLIDESHARKT